MIMYYKTSSSHTHLHIASFLLGFRGGALKGGRGAFWEQSAPLHEDQRGREQRHDGQPRKDAADDSPSGGSC